MADSREATVGRRVPVLPAELWAVVLSNLLHTGTFDEESKASLAATGGYTADLARAMRVNSEWHDIISLILYNRPTTSDLAKLLVGLHDAPISGVRIKRHSCALVKKLRIAAPPIDPSHLDVEPYSQAESDQRVQDLHRVRLLNVALGFGSSSADQDSDEGPTGEATARHGPVPADVEHVDGVGSYPQLVDQARTFPHLQSVEVAFCTANRVIFLPDRFSHLNAIQLLSPDHICLHYEPTENCVEVPIEDLRREVNGTQHLNVHIGRIDMQEIPIFRRENRLPVLEHGQTRWTLACATSMDNDRNAAWQQLEFLKHFIVNVLKFTIHRAPPRWGRLHIDFVLPPLQSVPPLQSPVWNWFVRNMKDMLVITQTNHRDWLRRLHPAEVMSEDRYHLTWAFVEKVKCGACGVVVDGHGAVASE